MLGERGFWPVVALVVLGHGAVLSQWRIAPWSIQDRQAGPQDVRVFRVRAIQPAPEPQKAVPVAPSPPPLPAPAVVPVPAPPPVPAQPGPPAPEAEASSTVSAAPPVDLPYIPRAGLTVTPKLKESVDVPFPEDVEGFVNVTVQATLFIEEDGSVRRVRVDTPDVQPPFERVIQQAFSGASFSPGEVEGLPVRSQMRVEVEFQAPVKRP